LSWSIGALVGFRIVQAVGAAMIQAVGAGLLVAAFPPSQRGQALGYIGTIVAAGISVGPVLGGLLLRYVGWQSIFYVNVPIGAAAILLSLRALPDDSQRNTQRFDIPGAALLASALLLVLLALTEGQNWGFVDPRTLGLLVAGLALLVGFVWWERRAAAPMIDLGLFRSLPLSMALISAVGTFVAISFNFFLLPFYLQGVLHYDTQLTGLTLLAGPLTLSLTSPLSGRFSDQIGTRWLSVIGLVLASVGLFGLSTVSVASSQLYIILWLVIGNGGFGIFQSPNNSTVMGNVPRSALGVAGSLLAVMRTVGQTAGIALAGAIFAVGVATAAGQQYNPITAAPPEALVAGLRVAMLTAGTICALGIIPTLLGRTAAPQSAVVKG
jgi:EmrB/QacA subfamily drug resistance transporter